MMDQQLDLFAVMNGEYKITKPIRLIELFSGIGAQHKALSILGVEFESWKTCEWAYNSIIGYNAIHIKDFTDYAKDMSKEQLLEYLNGNISIDYNEPADLTKKPIEWLKKCYNSCIANHNLMNIMKAKGKDLEIVDTDKYEYLLTYSFPCQDLSLAGKKLGMSVSQNDGGTRSGLLWEVKRLLDECNEIGNLPQILLMENVPEVVGERNIKDFQKWELYLSNLGYHNHIQIINGKNYGIPQNRRRCFMVSIIGGEYQFPQKIELKYRLKDFLEKQVDEKYYLSEKMIQYISADNDKWTGNNGQALVNKDIGCTINTAPTQRRCDASNYVADGLPNNTNLKEIANLFENGCKGLNRRTGAVYDAQNVAPTLLARNQGDNGFIAETNNNALNETLEQNEINDGDFIDAYNRNVKSDIAGTITTRVNASNETFVAQKIALKRGYDCEVKEEQENSNGVDIIGNYSKSNFVQTSVVGKNGVSPTITDNHGQVVAVAIKNNTEQGYLLAEEGDGINICGRMEYQRGNVQKGLAQTINTKGTDGGVVVKDED